MYCIVKCALAIAADARRANAVFMVVEELGRPPKILALFIQLFL